MSVASSPVELVSLQGDHLVEIILWTWFFGEQATRVEQVVAGLVKERRVVRPHGVSCLRVTGLLLQCTSL